MVKINEVVTDVLSELDRATLKFPKWPTDPIHAASIVAEESGELVQAVNEAVYEPFKASRVASRANIRKEAIETAAMCIRFIASLDAESYEWFHAAQHSQALNGKAGA